MGIDIEGSANPDSLTRGTVEFGVSGISTPQVLLNLKGTNGKNIDLSCYEDIFQLRANRLWCRASLVSRCDV
jgi:hypothetical protein